VTPAKSTGVFALALVAAGLLVSIAPARPAVDAPLIRVNASIGDVSLHMTRADVEARYGSPESTLAVVVPGGTGTLARYRPNGGLLLVTYDATAHVVALETDSRHYRTSGGVGPGTPAAGARRLAGFHTDFCSLGYWNGDAASDGTDIVTVFTVAGDRIDSVQIVQAALLASCGGAGGELPPEVGAGGFTVTTTVDPPGSGWLRSTPPGIDCPVDCSETFPPGTVVTFELHPSAGFLFDGWSEACAFLEPCVLRVTGPVNLVATFRLPPPPPPPPPSEEEPPPPPDEEPPPSEEGPGQGSSE
jgi:hypothetical protein